MTQDRENNIFTKKTIWQVDIVALALAVNAAGNWVPPVIIFPRMACKVVQMLPLY